MPWIFHPGVSRPVTKTQRLGLRLTCFINVYIFSCFNMADSILSKEKNLTVTHVPMEGGKMHTSSTTAFDSHPYPWPPVLPASFQFLSSVKWEVMESLCKLPLSAPYFLLCPPFWFVGFFFFVHGGHTVQGDNDFLVLNSNVTFYVLTSSLQDQRPLLWSPVRSCLLTSWATQMTRPMTTQPLSQN